MKKFMTLVIFLSASLAHAEIIKNSNYEVRHQNLIQQAILENCGLLGVLTQHASSKQTESYDQGIVDTHYTTVVDVEVPYDQAVSDTYRVVVRSTLYSGYDHAAKDWGIYEVRQVSCPIYR